MIEWLIKLVLVFIGTTISCLIFLKLTKKFQPKVYEDIIKCKWGK